MVFKVDKAVEFPDIIDFDKMFRPNGFVPIAGCVYGIYSFKNVIENP